MHLKLFNIHAYGLFIYWTKCLFLVTYLLSSSSRAIFCTHLLYGTGARTLQTTFPRLHCWLASSYILTKEGGRRGGGLLSVSTFCWHCSSMRGQLCSCLCAAPLDVPAPADHTCRGGPRLAVLGTIPWAPQCWEPHLSLFTPLVLEVVIASCVPLLLCPPSHTCGTNIVYQTASVWELSMVYVFLNGILTGSTWLHPGHEKGLEYQPK